MGNIELRPQTPLSPADSPKLNQWLKSMPDAQALSPSKEMRHLDLYNALNGTPETIGEMIHMANVLQDEIKKIFQVADILVHALEAIHLRLSSLKDACELFPPNIPPNKLLLQALEGARWGLKQFDYFK